MAFAFAKRTYPSHAKSPSHIKGGRDYVVVYFADLLGNLLRELIQMYFKNSIYSVQLQYSEILHLCEGGMEICFFDYLESVLWYSRNMRKYIPSVVKELSFLITQSCCYLSVVSSRFRTNCHTQQDDDFIPTCDFCCYYDLFF